MSDALLEAIQTRDVDRVAALLAAGADPNEPGKSRYGSGGVLPPLHAAIAELEAFGEDEPGGPIDAVTLLLRHGARVNGWDVNKEGDPLLDAVVMKHIEAARLLLAAGADPNVSDNEGTSPLRFCALNGLLEMARLLLNCGAGKTIHEAGGSAGMNALGTAAYWLDVEMVKLLLAHGADPHIEDNDSDTVFDRLRWKEQLMDQPEDPADQDRLREIRKLLGEPSA
ncbi:MAG: ankyrin repeat domain-containing protein [Polyangiaceae bacterium]|nr:ankyrin repeat domain-containing protein [Polyangiaceae bacterium]